MSILIKGIDLPKDDNYIVLEIEKNGTVEAYSSTFGEVDGDPIAIQIDRPHGRLGDLDKLFEEVGKIRPRNQEHYKAIGEFMNLITNTPTILKAGD